MEKLSTVLGMIVVCVFCSTFSLSYMGTIVSVLGGIALVSFIRFAKL